LPDGVLAQVLSPHAVLAELVVPDGQRLQLPGADALGLQLACPDAVLRKLGRRVRGAPEGDEHRQRGHDVGVRKVRANPLDHP
jgi:hypothetical protein